MSAYGGSISSTMICGGFQIVNCILAIWILWMFFWYVCCSSSISLISIIREILCSNDSSFLSTFDSYCSHSQIKYWIPCYKITFLLLNTSPWTKYWWFICYLLCQFSSASKISVYPYSSLLNPSSLENKKIFNQSILTWFYHNSLLTLLISRDKEFPISHSLLSLFSNI